MLAIRKHLLFPDAWARHSLHHFTTGQRYAMPTGLSSTRFSPSRLPSPRLPSDGPAAVGGTPTGRDPGVGSPRVLVVDDHRTFAELLAGALAAEGMDIVGIAHSAGQAVTM